MLELTPIGQSILPAARLILDTIDQQMLNAAATAQSQTGHLTLGFSPGLSPGRMRGGIVDFIAAVPQLQSRLVEALPQELRRRLNERAIDLMIVAPTPKLESRTLVQEQLWDERLFLALSADHAFVKQVAVSWDDVANVTIILKNFHFELVGRDRLDRQVRLEQYDVSCATLQRWSCSAWVRRSYSGPARSRRGVVYRGIRLADLARSETRRAGDDKPLDER